ncbi:MAG: UDP-N-acetylmuramoyl-tripeptide--D-alanyl-D-alanine ligase [Acidobacteria bacterium]|nr:UDP-N-acetylmuramoyl-tripeptide--D-alanyl-D-alanine ligase [Acidobacteriota bacterium]
MTIDVSQWPVSGYSVDTRTLAAGDLFFALRGACHDGHDYVAEALRKGAAGAVVDHEIPGLGPALVVEDTLRALQELARRARIEWGGKVVAVTGSAGKTTTKDYIARLLETELAVGKTEGNLNNHVGLPLSILRLPDACRVAVLEMGMNHAGEIRELCGIAQPDVGVVTNVGCAHVEYFDGIEGVAAAKRELVESLPPGGVAVLNADDPLVAGFRAAYGGRTLTFGLSAGADVRAEDVEAGEASTRFTVDGARFDAPLAGLHSVRNALAAIAVARVFGIPAARLTGAVSALEPGKMRGERLVHNGVTIWNDAYNSNPEAVRSMLDVLAATPARRRWAVLGEMLELGRSAEPLHREVGRYVAERGIDVLIGIRGAARHMVEEAGRAGLSGAAYFFETPEAAGDFVRQKVEAGDALLFKGSRGVAVEKALERVLE